MLQRLTSLIVVVAAAADDDAAAVIERHGRHHWPWGLILCETLHCIGCRHSETVQWNERTNSRRRRRCRRCRRRRTKSARIGRFRTPIPHRTEHVRHASASPPAAYSSTCRQCTPYTIITFIVHSMYDMYMDHPPSCHAIMSVHRLYDRLRPLRTRPARARHMRPARQSQAPWTQCKVRTDTVYNDDLKALTVAM